MTNRWLGALAAGALAVSAGGASAADLVFLSDNVPTNLNVDGAGGTVPASLSGQGQVLEGLIGYQAKGKNNEGLGVLDFSKYQPKLAESWTFDPQTFTYTFKLRRNVVGCNGETFNADDVLYTFARAKSVTGAAAIAYFLANVGSIKSFHQPVGVMLAARNAANEARRDNKPAPSPDPRDLGDEVRKIDDYTVAIRQEIPNRLFLAVLPIFGMIRGATPTPTRPASSASARTASRNGRRTSRSR
jgi:peptide/nickel transport system substrate-binding protein